EEESAQTFRNILKSPVRTHKPSSDRFGGAAARRNIRFGKCNIRFGKYLGRIRSHRTPGLTLV
ncbi:hypothetical protein OSI28_07825, partial [Mycobacterium ulcerans]